MAALCDCSFPALYWTKVFDLDIALAGTTPPSLEIFLAQEKKKIVYNWVKSIMVFTYWDKGIKDHASKAHLQIIMSPQPQRREDILLLERILSASAFLLSALYLMNQWVDFDQTCTDTLLGGGKK